MRKVGQGGVWGVSALGVSSAQEQVSSKALLVESSH